MDLDRHNGVDGEERTERLVEAPGTAPAAGHDKHAGHSVAMFRERSWLRLAPTVRSSC